MQTKRLLCFLYKNWQIRPFIHLHSSLNEHSFGCALDKLFCATNSQGKVVIDRALKAI